MTAAMGLGAVVGGLFVAARGRTGLPPLILAAAAFGVLLAGAALAPTLGVELVALALVGGASIGFMSTGNSTLQLSCGPEMRGRVMSLWFVAFQGSTPIGGPIVGWVMAAAGARAGLGLGAMTCLLVARWVCSRCARSPRSPAPTPPRDQPSPEDEKKLGGSVGEEVDQQLVDALGRVVLHPVGGIGDALHAQVGHPLIRRFGKLAAEVTIAASPQITIVGAGIGFIAALRRPRRAPQSCPVVVDHPGERPRLRPGLDVAFQVLVGERLFGVRAQRALGEREVVAPEQVLR